MTSALLAYAAAGGRLAVLEIEGYWDDVARPANVIRLQQTMMSYSGADAPTVAVDAQVSADAVLESPVYIGPGAVIGVATVGPNVVIGAGCTVSDGCLLTNAVCFAGAKLGMHTSASHAVIEAGARTTEGARLVGTEAEPVCVPAG